MTPEQLFEGKTDHELIIILMTEWRDFKSNINGYVPNHCIVNEGKIAQLEKDVATRNESDVWLKRALLAAAFGFIIQLLVKIPSAIAWVGKLGG